MFGLAPVTHIRLRTLRRDTDCDAGKREPASPPIQGGAENDAQASRTHRQTGVAGRPDQPPRRRRHQIEQTLTEASYDANPAAALSAGDPGNLRTQVEFAYTRTTRGSRLGLLLLLCPVQGKPRFRVELYPGDERLVLLREGECDTDNLFTYPGVAASGERMNHDEFMRRLLVLSGIDATRVARLQHLGSLYLAGARQAAPMAKAQSIASYEDGGLEHVFSAILRAPDWSEPALQAFRHFLVEHIKFDSDPDAGHGALSRHMISDDRILPLWTAFRDLLIAAAPGLRA